MKVPMLIIFIVSLFTHLLFFGQPKEVVFDEVYTGNFISSYSQDRYYFDIHPPLGKLISHYVGKFAGIDYTNTDFGSIGNTIQSKIIILRIVPLIAGILLPLILFLICINLGMSRSSSFAVGILITLENSLLVQSRFILFDIIMLSFGFLSILLYLLYVKDSKNKYLLIFSAVFSGLAFSIKWTGLAFVLFIIIYEFIRIKSVKKTAQILLVYGIIGIIIYINIFAVHFSYFSDIQGSLFHNILQLNIDMLKANTNMTATHSYSSVWYTWPIMLRPIFYWQNFDKGQFIYLLGNPFIYWLGSLSILWLFILTLFRKLNNNISNFIILGFIVNFLPFIMIGRVMFLYHYEAALIFSVVAIVYCISLIKSNIYRLISLSSLIFICLISFIYFSPLTYGLHVDDEQLQNRMWLSTWR